MMSWNGNISVFLALVKGSTGHRWIPPQRPVTRSFNVLFDLRLDKRFSKQSRRQFVEFTWIVSYSFAFNELIMNCQVYLSAMANTSVFRSLV